MDDDVYFEALLTDRSPTTAKSAARWLTSRGIVVDFVGTGAYSISAHCSKELFDTLNINNTCEYITLIEIQSDCEVVFLSK